MPNAQTEPLAVDAHEAAKLLSVSRRKLFDLTAPRGPIRSVRIGKDHRYAMEELKRYLRDGMNDAVPASA